MSKPLDDLSQVIDALAQHIDKSANKEAKRVRIRLIISIITGLFVLGAMLYSWYSVFYYNA